MGLFSVLLADVGGGLTGAGGRGKSRWQYGLTWCWKFLVPLRLWPNLSGQYSWLF